MEFRKPPCPEDDSYCGDDMDVGGAWLAWARPASMGNAVRMHCMQYMR